MKISEPILSDHVLLAPGQPLPRLVHPRGAAEVQSKYWTSGRVLLLSLLMLGPIAFGAVQSWAWGGIAVLATLVLLLWGLGCVTTGSAKILKSPLYIPLAALLVIAAVQLQTRLSMDRIATREALLKLLIYGILFFVGQQLYLVASAKAWRVTFATAAIYMFVMAVFAITQYFTSPGLLFGYLPESNGVFGTYVNHGNYAGLMEMLIPMAMALAISLPWGHQAKPFLLFLVFVAVVSVFLSGSRAGLVSLAAEFVIVAIILAMSGSDQKHTLVVGILAVSLAVAFFYWLDPGDIWGRWQQMASRPELALGQRQVIARDSLRLARDHMGAGVGLGAFQTAYTPYQTVATDLNVDYAHNDYIQFAAEAGIWGWILMPVSLAMFFALTFRHLRSRLHHQNGWLQFGAAVGVCGLLVHSFSEFNLHIPANAAWFVFLVSLATLPAKSNRHHRESHGLS